MIRIVGDLELPAPNPILDEASGKMTIGAEKPFNIENNQFLLRGASLRNTSWIVGVVAYTGNETKIMMNAEGSRFKQSQVQ